MYYKFTPILKNTIWGGTKIAPFKNIQTSLRKVGESWEISGVPGNETIVSGGPYAGRNLNDLVAEQKEALVGKANYERFGNEFPLLIKFIDARDDLSIQVHPTDEIAHRQGRERGKTEMWYLMPSEPEATLLCGLKKHITPDEYKRMVSEKTIVDAIARYPVHEGDCFFLPAGRIHAIGSGCFLAEIQQTSDVTYRIYDFDRHDDLGRPRELHTELAAESINYDVLPDYQTHYTPAKNQRVQLVECPYFTTSVYDLDQPINLDYTSLDSFVILIGLSGAGIVTEAEGTRFVLRAGETILLPATTGRLSVEGTVKFLETYVG
ncbi:MAG: class I mannose-6-phosphate isomerase [Prevotella sp.]|nr:class I mannose-6-phosphate isomerase [Prevotella sp.]